MTDDNVFNLGSASIGTELMFGVLISSVNLINSDKDSKGMMLTSLVFDLSKIAITSLFMNLSRRLARRVVSSWCRALLAVFSIFTAVAVAMISNMICMWICINIWNKEGRTFPGLKELSIVSLVLFSVVRVGLFTAFMLSFVKFARVRKDDGFVPCCDPGKTSVPHSD